MNWKDQFNSLEKSHRWEEALEFLRNTTQQQPDNVEAYVRAIYLLWDLLLEVTHRLDKDLLEKALRQYYYESRERFANNPEYLFFVGYFSGVGEWYFGHKTQDTSRRMLEKAAQLEPEDFLYQWGAHSFVVGDKSGRDLASIVLADPAKVAWLESRGTPGQYIIDMLKHRSNS